MKHDYTILKDEKLQELLEIRDVLIKELQEAFKRLKVTEDTLRNHQLKIQEYYQEKQKAPSSRV